MRSKRNILVHESPACKRILAALEAAAGLSKTEIAEVAHVSVNALSGGGYLKALRKARLIFVCGWRLSGGAFRTRLYAAGDLPDVPRPRTASASVNPTMTRIHNLLTERRRLTTLQMAQALGLCEPTVLRNVRRLIALDMAHISSWHRNKNGPIAPVYTAGPGDEAPKPRAYTASEKSYRYKVRNGQVGVMQILCAGIMRARRNNTVSKQSMKPPKSTAFSVRI